MIRESIAEKIIELLEIMERLRSEQGCPWDREQNHVSLRPYIIEEAHEVVEAINCNSMEGLIEELGDVLLQIVFHAQIGSETDSFTMLDVIEAIINKLIRRHPHVYGTTKAENSTDVLQNWQQIKDKEKSRDSSADPFYTVASALPQLVYAYKIQEKAARHGFDWSEIESVKDKVREEWIELWNEIELKSEQEKIEEEFGDFLFAAVNLSRFLNIHPEEALRKASTKFKRRFNAIVDQIGDIDKLGKMTLPEMDAVWDYIKEIERK